MKTTTPNGYITVEQSKAMLVNATGFVSWLHCLQKAQAEGFTFKPGEIHHQGRNRYYRQSAIQRFCQFINNGYKEQAA